ncbi:hypothetical protein CFS9_39030 [Flavobacterium sp. CFS9]|uniref:Uncharacterized protein n=1 Tax=Flavobacterium sp. CFS9 TaxID=3143118 RepID=A0AAT9H7A3_9FLAO
MQNKSLREILHDQYQNEPIIRLFVELIGSALGFPISSVVFDTLIGIKAKETAANRMRSFYDELNNGDIQLDETLLENDDFLHSYFSVVNYVIRSKSNEKASKFAKIIKSLYKQDINVQQFEDYSSIFDELTEREFIILCIKRDFENTINPIEIISEDKKMKNPFQITTSYWNDFFKEVDKVLNISPKELEALLIRAQRTGCYVLHTGYWDMSNVGCGDTSVIFHKIYDIIKNE